MATSRMVVLGFQGLGGGMIGALICGVTSLLIDPGVIDAPGELTDGKVSWWLAVAAILGGLFIGTIFGSLPIRGRMDSVMWSCVFGVFVGLMGLFLVEFAVFSGHPPYSRISGLIAIPCVIILGAAAGGIVDSSRIRAARVISKKAPSIDPLD